MEKVVPGDGGKGVEEGEREFEGVGGFVCILQEEGIRGRFSRWGVPIELREVKCGELTPPAAQIFSSRPSAVQATIAPPCKSLIRQPPTSLCPV